MSLQAEAAPEPPAPVQALDWVDLYEEIGEKVYRLLHRMTGDSQLSEDLLHDTFVIAINRTDQYAGTGKPSAWIYRIAANLVHERARTARRRDQLLHEAGFAAERISQDDSGRVAARIILEKAVLSLSEECRTTLLLYEVDGFSHQEIAEMMGVAEGSSRARLARAKAELRKILTREDCR